MRRTASGGRARVDGDLVRSPATAAWVALGLLAVAGGLTAIVAIDPVDPAVQALDDAWRRVALDLPDPVHDAGEVLETIGSGLVMVPLRVAVAAWLVWRGRRWDLAAWLLGWALADVITAILKPGIGRARPTPIDPDDPLTSFPSAHAKTAAQVAIGLVLVLSSPWRGRAVAYALAVAWTMLMAVSRTVVDHHWLSDVAAGAAIGAGAALAVAAVVQRVRDERTAEPAPG